MSIPIDSRARACWLFNERFDSVLPADASGYLIDLENDSTLTLPPVTSAIGGAGHGRVFDASATTGLEVVDTDDDLLLTSSVSIIGVMALNVTALNDAGGTGTIVCRGRDTEKTPWGLRVQVLDEPTDSVRLRLYWENAAGTEVVDQGVDFIWDDGEEYLIAAIRERSGSGMKCRYVVNGSWSAGSTISNADIDGDSGSTVFVGCEPSGASAYTNHFDGVISFLTVLNDAVAVEEVFKVWRMFNEDAPKSGVALRGHLPRGPYDKADKDTSAVHGELDVEASIHALVRNDARDISDFYLPGKAFGDRLEDWEAITKRKRFPTDTIDDRQERVSTWLQRKDGYNLEGLRYQLAELLGYSADPTKLDLITNEVTRTEDFSTAPTDVIITQGNGSVAVAAGVLDIDVSADVVNFTGAFDDIPSHVWPLTGSLDTFFGGKVTRNATPTADDVLIGFVVGSKQTRDWLFIGMVYDGADYSVAYSRWQRSTGTMSAFAVLENPFNDADVFFRIRHKGAGVYDVQWGTSDAAAQAQNPTEIAGPNNPLWAGFTAAGNTSNNVDVDYSFDDWYTHEVEGVASATFFLYRNPSDAGEYDLEGANALLAEIIPAHFEGYVIDQLTLECDDTDTGCDRQPMGV